MNCGSYGGMKLLKHGMKIIEKVFEGRMRALVDFHGIPFVFMPGREAADALFLVQCSQNEHRTKGK